MEEPETSLNRGRIHNHRAISPNVNAVEFNQFNRSQTDYHTEAFVPENWEILGPPPSDKKFISMQVNIVGKISQPVDPMFADFGGLQDQSRDRRWHLSEADGDRLNQLAENPPAPTMITLSIEELEQLKEKLKQEAYQASFEDTMNQLKEARDEFNHRYEVLLSDLRRELAHELSLLEKRAVDLSLAVARKVIDLSVEIKPDYIRAIIDKAMTAAGSSDIYRVRISKEDFDYIERHGLIADLVKSQEDNKQTWSFIADESIKRGCSIETSQGDINFILDEAFARLQTELKAATANG